MIAARERRTAIHEDGHAVAFYRLFGDVPRYSGDLSIVRRDDMLGSHSAEEWLDATDDEAVYACAGYAALIAAGFTEEIAVEGCANDFECAVNFSDVPLARSKAAAVELLRRPENVAAVNLLATRLMARKRIPGDEVDILMDVADGHATEAEFERYLELKGGAGGES